MPASTSCSRPTPTRYLLHRGIGVGKVGEMVPVGGEGLMDGSG